MKNLLHKFTAASQSGVLTLYCYDVIGQNMFGDGITAQSVADACAEKNFNSICLRVNSPGGDPFEAVAISNLLRAQNKPIAAHVDGLAASAASLLVMCGNTISMGKQSMLMIHNAATQKFGDAKAMRQMAELLDKVSGVMLEAYANRTGLPADEVKAMMDTETWFTASEARAANLADPEEDDYDENDEEDFKRMTGSFDLSSFRNTPVALLAARVAYTQEELKRLRLRLA